MYIWLHASRVGVLHLCVKHDQIITERVYGTWEIRFKEAAGATEVVLYMPTNLSGCWSAISHTFSGRRHCC